MLTHIAKKPKHRYELYCIPTHAISDDDNNFITHTYVTQRLKRLKEESRTKWERQCIDQIPKHYKYTAKSDHPISVCDHKCGKRNIREHENRRCDAASAGIGRWP